MALVAVNGVLPLPTAATEVLEAFEVSAEIRPHHSIAHGAQRVLEIGVYLDLGGRGRGRERISQVKLCMLCYHVRQYDYVMCNRTLGHDVMYDMSLAGGF